MTTTLWILGIAAYLLIGVRTARRTMFHEWVAAPSYGCLRFYFFTRTIAWPLLFFRRSNRPLP